MMGLMKCRAPECDGKTHTYPFLDGTIKMACPSALSATLDVLEKQARLIAAAPEMKEALIEARSTILELLHCEADFRLAVGSDEDWVRFIDAALAKANGSAA